MKELKSIKTALEGIHLTAAEKQQGAQEFARFMKQSALDIEEAPSFYERLFHSSRRFVLTSATVMGMLAISTGGVSYAAESTVPGDLLYLVKTEFTEPIRGFFYFTPESKVNWEVQQFKRRLEEAQILTSQGQIQGEFKDQLNQKLEGTQNQILGYVEDLRDQEQDEEADAIIENLGLMMSENTYTMINIDFKPKPPVLEAGIEPEILIQNPDLQQLHQVHMGEHINGMNGMLTNGAPILNPIFPPLPPKGILDGIAEEAELPEEESTEETVAKDPEETAADSTNADATNADATNADATNETPPIEEKIEEKTVQELEIKELQME